VRPESGGYEKRGKAQLGRSDAADLPVLGVARRDYLYPAIQYISMK
jgi:hypothetical protein